MKKKRIILADADYMYLSPLEIKMIEELDDYAEIELVTDYAYLKELFSKPHTIDVLVIGNEWYIDECQKQNCKHTFILTDEPTVENSNGAEITYIYKYTSIKEIYRRIYSLSRLSEDMPSLKGKTEVVLFYSPIGGCGKTTLSLSVAASLAKEYKKVLYISAERLHTFQQYISGAGNIETGAYKELISLKNDVYRRVKPYIRTADYDYLPPFNAAISSLGIDFSVYERIIEEAKESNEYDLIIVDTDTIFDENKASLISLADRVVVLLRQNEASIYTVNTLLKNINHTDYEKYLFICNLFEAQKENMLLTSKSEMNFILAEYVPYSEAVESGNLEQWNTSAEVRKIATLIS